ncbi:MAG: DUF1926 domain-containing protein [candidate division KSB1 bacterium]|nr:DUF1926 domain-containing protein [candidate division KSB1 bacterium]
MGTIHLALGIHNHQPVGNFDFVFEDAYQRAYLPFLEVLERHPFVRVAEHYSGILLEWLEKNHPDFLDRLARLVDRGQVEMMTGGYYEPILPIIPDRDKLGQIAKLTDYLVSRFGKRPRGLWLAERVWEPHLPRPLREAGVEYVVIDDAHLKYSGLQEEELVGYFLTEEAGFTVNIFPISERLRYTIPFRPVEETLDYLRQMADESGRRLIVFADDGEKFGIWPGTYEHCYQGGWLEAFFQALEANRDWIRILHFSEALDQLEPRGRVYLPTASYREMMEWALPARAIHEYEDFEDKLKQANLFDRYKVFVRGGFWRNFLAKYEEANHLHKKMLRVSRKVRDAAERYGQDHEVVKRARDHLWAGQCNCPYWHGVFGGLYLTNLRYAVYHELIQAEKELDTLRGNAGNGWIDWETADFNGDGRREIIVETPTWQLIFEPDYGGRLVELDYKGTGINLLDTMTRREEGYHRKLLRAANPSPSSGEVASIHDLLLAKEEGLEKRLTYDWYRRCSLVDHFLDPHTTLDDFARCKYGEQGDFVLSPYQASVIEGSSQSTVRLTREGAVWVNGSQRAVRLEKLVSVNPASAELEFRIRVANPGPESLELWYACELNFALLAGEAPDRYFRFPGAEQQPRHLASSGEVRSTEWIALVDEWQGVEFRLEFSPAVDVWRFPVETVSMSEAGFERVYQSSVILPNVRRAWGPGEVWEMTIRLRAIPR